MSSACCAASRELGGRVVMDLRMARPELNLAPRLGRYEEVAPLHDVDREPAREPPEPEAADERVEADLRTANAKSPVRRLELEISDAAEATSTRVEDLAVEDVGREHELPLDVTPARRRTRVNADAHGRSDRLDVVPQDLPAVAQAQCAGRGVPCANRHVREPSDARPVPFEDLFADELGQDEDPCVAAISHLGRAPAAARPRADGGPRARAR